MITKGLFKKHKNILEGSDQAADACAQIFAEEPTPCPKCKKPLLEDDLQKNLSVCPYCGHHFKINAAQRIALLFDEGSFEETDGDILPENPLNFPGYDEKLKSSALKSGEKEAVICGRGKIGGFDCCAFVMEPDFMMGSMGTVVGEKITRLFEDAAEKSLPVVGCSVSGGARMQEGILSLMQMAKVSGAVGRHSLAGNLYISLLTDPTTGGVTASFAMLGDIILAEPGALICFAGPRVIEQTIRQRLPEGFQRAEFVFDTGFIDNIVPRGEQRGYIGTLLKLHQREAGAK